MFCSNCGRELPENINICPNCGFDNKSGEAPEPKSFFYTKKYDFSYATYETIETQIDAKDSVLHIKKHKKKGMIRSKQSDEYCDIPVSKIAQVNGKRTFDIADMVGAALLLLVILFIEAHWLLLLLMLAYIYSALGYKTTLRLIDGASCDILSSGLGSQKDFREYLDTLVEAKRRKP